MGLPVRDNENITDVPEIETIDELTNLSWKRRMYWANIPPNFHACLAFMFEVEPRTLPAAITGKASITSDGYIMASGVKPDGDSFMGGFIASTRDFQDSMKWAADHGRLSDEDRGELSDFLNDWIGNNYSGFKFKI